MASAREEAARQYEAGVLDTDDAQSGFVKGAEWLASQMETIYDEAGTFEQRVSRILRLMWETSPDERGSP